MGSDYSAPRSHSKLSRSAFLPWLGTWEPPVIPKKLQFSDDVKVANFPQNLDELLKYGKKVSNLIT